MKEDFLDRVANRYRRGGYRVYGLLPGLKSAPEGWIGPIPDLCVEKGDRRLAKLIRTGSELKDMQELENIQAMLKNPGFNVQLYVFSRGSLRAAKKLRGRLRGLSSRRRVQICAVRRIRRGKRVWNFYNYYRRSRLEGSLAFFVIVAGSLLFATFYYLPSVLSEYAALDIERNSQLEDGEGKSDRLKELERKLDRLRAVGRRRGRGMDVGKGMRRLKELESKVLAELRRRAGRNPGRGKDVLRELKQLRELKSRALEEMRRRGLTLNDLKKKGLPIEELLRRGILP